MNRVETASGRLGIGLPAFFEVRQDRRQRAGRQRGRQRGNGIAAAVEAAFAPRIRAVADQVGQRFPARDPRPVVVADVGAAVVDREPFVGLDLIDDPQKVVPLDLAAQGDLRQAH